MNLTLPTQIWLPGLDPFLKAQLADADSPLSYALTRHYRLDERKPSLGARLRLMYHLVVVKRQAKDLLSFVFRIDRQHAREPRLPSAPPSIKNIGRAAQAMLARTKINTTQGFNLVLKPWHEAVTATHTTEFVSKKEHQKVTHIVALHATKVLTPDEMDAYVEAKARFLTGNYLPWNLLEHQFDEHRADHIGRRRRNKQQFAQMWNECVSAFNSRYRLNQFDYDPSAKAHRPKTEGGLKHVFGVTSYGDYVARLLNGYWHHYQVTLAEHHNTQTVPKKRRLKGVQGRNRGWANLVAAFVMDHWDDDMFQRFFHHASITSVHRSLPSKVAVNRRIREFMSNFRVVDNTKPLDPQADRSRYKLEKSKPNKNPPPVQPKNRRFESFIEMLDYYFRDKTNERLRMFRTMVLRKNPTLKPFFPENVCIQAEERIRSWLTYPLKDA